MLAYAHGVGDVPLLGETIGAALARTVARHGSRDALIVRAQSYRAAWRQLGDESARVARALLALGVERDDRGGIWSPNRWQCVVTPLACARAGAIPVNLNPAYKTSANETALRHSATSTLVHQ